MYNAQSSSMIFCTWNGAVYVSPSPALTYIVEYSKCVICASKTCGGDCGYVMLMYNLELKVPGPISQNGEFY